MLADLVGHQNLAHCGGGCLLLLPHMGLHVAYPLSTSHSLALAVLPCLHHMLGTVSAGSTAASRSKSQIEAQGTYRNAGQAVTSGQQSKGIKLQARQHPGWCEQVLWKNACTASYLSLLPGLLAPRLKELDLAALALMAAAAYLHPVALRECGVHCCVADAPTAQDGRWQAVGLRTKFCLLCVGSLLAGRQR